MGSMWVKTPKTYWDHDDHDGVVNIHNNQLL